MNYANYTTSDHLYMLTEGWRHLTVTQAEWVDVDTVKYWMVLANCNACTIPGQTFEDLFPAKEVAEYRDQEGKPLDELALEFQHHASSKRVIYRPSQQIGGRVEYQLDYVRWYLVPRFAATLVNLFSTLIYTYRNRLGGEMGEPPERSKDIPCPSLVWNGLAPAGDAARLDGTETTTKPEPRPVGPETPKDRFFRMLDEMGAPESKREEFLRAARELNGVQRMTFAKLQDHF